MKTVDSENGVYYGSMLEKSSDFIKKEAEQKKKRSIAAQKGVVTRKTRAAAKNGALENVISGPQETPPEAWEAAGREMLEATKTNVTYGKGITKEDVDTWDVHAEGKREDARRAEEAAIEGVENISPEEWRAEHPKKETWQEKQAKIASNMEQLATMRNTAESEHITADLKQKLREGDDITQKENEVRELLKKASVTSWDEGKLARVSELMIERSEGKFNGRDITKFTPEEQFVANLTAEQFDTLGKELQKELIVRHAIKTTDGPWSDRIRKQPQIPKSATAHSTLPVQPKKSGGFLRTLAERASTLINSFLAVAAVSGTIASKEPPHRTQAEQPTITHTSDRLDIRQAPRSEGQVILAEIAEAENKVSLHDYTVKRDRESWAWKGLRAQLLANENFKNMQLTQQNRVLDTLVRSLRNSPDVKKIFPSGNPDLVREGEVIKLSLVQPETIEKALNSGR